MEFTTWLIIIHNAPRHSLNLAKYHTRSENCIKDSSNMQPANAYSGREDNAKPSYRIVICFAISPPFPVTPPSRDVADVDPGFFSKSFQNFKLSSAAMFISVNVGIELESKRAYLLLPASVHQG